MRELNYPFDGAYVLKKKKSLKRELIASGSNFVEKKIAVLGGSTTHDIIACLDLFLLNQGIKCEFYESEYGKFYEDVMFDNPELKEFGPDLIYIHTSNKNIINKPDIQMSPDDVNTMIDAEFSRFVSVWQKIKTDYNCPIIQNNFEAPFYRILGNKDATAAAGFTRYINRLNEKFAEYADTNNDFFIQDINYLSADYGLSNWADLKAWHMYKYAMAIDAIPTVSYNLANIVKSIFGKNKKALALDLDNTLWGGIVGDDGVEGIEIGNETPVGEIYEEFQKYLKAQKDLGIILNIISKNDHENAIAGLNHPDSVLHEDDFVEIKANWDPKSKNLVEMASELNLLPEAFVFVDDNPAEREIIRQQVENSCVPEIGQVEEYIKIIDRAGFFEATNISQDDAKRSKMYAENAKRLTLEKTFADYGEYLDSLEMVAEIDNFAPVYLDRIAQLTNKSNQFNLTTKRYTRAEIEEVANSDEYVDLYGRLTDKFGDNGVVSVAIGHKIEDVLHIDLFIMSCRVLKRDMEFAMMDSLVSKALEKGIKEIKGYYYPTAKNSMVKSFYETMGFTLVSVDENGNSEWTLNIEKGYNKKCAHIKF